MTKIPCPNCGETTDASPANSWRPFCSRRCKLIDLGDWLTEEHRIPGKSTEPSWAGDEPSDRSDH